MVSHKVGCLVFWLDYLAATVVILVADVKQLSDNNCNRTPNCLSAMLVKISSIMGNCVVRSVSFHAGSIFGSYLC